MLARFRKISYVLAYAVAAIPLWYYIHYARILALITVAVVFAYIMVVLSTVDAAQAILSSEKAKMALPRWLPDKPKYHKWWMLVRHTLKWHLLLIPAKMGLALGFVEFLRTDHRYALNVVLKPYVYASQSIPIYPQWETLLLGICTIGLFTILECFLISALSTLSYRLRGILILHLLISLSIIGIASQLRFLASRSLSRNEICFIQDCSQCDEKIGCYNTLYYNAHRQNIRFVETIETGFLTLDGKGILLTANIMRPLPWAEFDNRPFVARQIVAGILGLLLYAGTTWLILWFVEDEV